MCLELIDYCTQGKLNIKANVTTTLKAWSLDKQVGGF